MLPLSVEAKDTPFRSQVNAKLITMCYGRSDPDDVKFGHDDQSSTMSVTRRINTLKICYDGQVDTVSQIASQAL